MLHVDIYILITNKSRRTEFAVVDIYKVIKPEIQSLRKTKLFATKKSSSAKSEGSRGGLSILGPGTPCPPNPFP